MYAAKGPNNSAMPNPASVTARVSGIKPTNRYTAAIRLRTRHKNFPIRIRTPLTLKRTTAIDPRM